MNWGRIAPLGALLAGCTVGPNYNRPEMGLPPTYAEPNSAESLSDAQLASWWTAFGDPELNKLINRAIAQNLDVETAAARIREARAEERVAGASALPEVSANGSVTHQRISEHAIPVPPGTGEGSTGSFGLPGSEFTTFRVGFDASWEIDLFGKTRRQIEGARARTGAAIWNRRDAQVSTSAEVASAYIAFRALQEQIALSQAEVERQRRSSHLVGARVRGGLVTGQDLEQQNSEAAAAQAAIPPLRAEAAAQIHKIGVLVGDSPESLIAELSPTGVSLPTPPSVPAGLPSDLLRRRPDIRAAERNLAAATADIGVATADLYPRFTLSAAPALVSTALASLLEWGSRNFSGGAAIDWPIFNGGGTRANIDVKNAQQEQALIAYRKTILTALQDVEDALSKIDNDRSEIGELDSALRSASRAEGIARTRYTGGLVTYSDVLQAQANRIALENRLVETTSAEGRDTVALYKALGGGWPDLAEAGSQ
ncbi:MAG TPA: efflux transporter outer membrane subunit [Sphingomicrobium sp.]|jgi:NodT family efflux transporter outer membrane factor (OMF) lipoprotein|nr:efflux transporter outer membrane subunit [Sphingomicrobium sp.]